MSGFANIGRVTMNPAGVWSATQEYKTLDVVTYDNDSYVAKTANVGKIPGEVESTDYWQALTTGVTAAVQLADEKAILADEKAILADEKAILADEKAALADDAATNAKSKASEANTAAGLANNAARRADVATKTAQSDHTQAASDHEIATADHETAQSDHTQAASDHEIATADHETAQSDHTQAQRDHDSLNDLVETEATRAKSAEKAEEERAKAAEEVISTELSEARKDYTGHTYDTIGARMNSIEHTVHAIGRNVEVDLDSMSEIIQSGSAEEIYPTGLVLDVPWVDARPESTTSWTNKLNVVDHAPAAILIDGQEAQSNVLAVQQALTLPFSTQFDPIQAFYAAPAGGLAAGKYCIEIGTTYQKVTAGDIYAFTTTVDLPEGGQLVFASSIYSYTPVQAGICSYASGSSSTALETLAVSKVDSTDGYTSLGKLTTENVDYDGTLNHLHRAALGSNRWRDSALRQFLNAESNEWFKPATKWSRPPSYVSYSGYLSGFDAEFVAHMATAVIKTCIPYCDGAASMSADVDTTYDRVFLPSAEQLYWTCTSLGCPYGAEGDAWDYWQQAYGKTSPATMWTVHEEYIMYGMGAETSPRDVFERSAYRGNGSYVALCSTTGTLSSSSASNGHYCAPACYII